MMNLPVIHFPDLPQQFAAALALLAPELSLSLAEEGIPVRIILSDGGISLRRTADGITLSCRRVSEFCRALSHLTAHLEDDSEVSEKGRFSMLCYMADASRNAVFNLPTAKKILRLLALCGYDSMMLYTEDTFEVPEYPYFGHMRGRYTHAELRELDDYADALGIELIPCIQTLAHLATALRWKDMAAFSDTNDILLVGDERTYAFIDAMLETCRSCFRSRRINIGMDEAHALGLGKYLKKNGYTPAHEIMLAHLERVIAQCHEKGFRPMMWSDMFFRMAFGGKYYVKEGEIAESVIDRVPEGVTLIYWDYYSYDRALVEHMVDCHLKFKNPAAFAGGAWKWTGYAPHNYHSIVSTKLQLDICLEKGLDQIIVTGWGDNGGEASQFSVLPSLLYFAERAYTDRIDEAYLESRARACFGIGFADLMALDAPDDLPAIYHAAGNPRNPHRYLLYNDPMLGMMDKMFDPERDPAVFAENADRLLALSGHKGFGYLFRTLGLLCRVLARKSDLTVRMRAAYLADERGRLRTIAEEEIPQIISDLDRFIDAFRTQWECENKPFGFESHELRLGGLRLRLESTARRLVRYLDGAAPAIPELEQPVLDYACRTDPAIPHIGMNVWTKMASPGLL